MAAHSSYTAHSPGSTKDVFEIQRLVGGSYNQLQSIDRSQLFSEQTY